LIKTQKIGFHQAEQLKQKGKTDSRDDRLFAGIQREVDERLMLDGETTYAR